MQISLTFYMRCVEIIRRLAFAISLLALCTLVLWAYDGGVLEKADKEIKKNHVKQYTARYDEAKSLSTSRPDEAIKQLLGLLNDVQKVKNLDRLANVKASTLELLARTYWMSGQPSESLHWAKIWTDFDKKDLRASALYAEYLLGNEGSAEEAKEYIEKLFELVPEVDFIAELYAELLLRENEHVRAVRILLDLYKKAQKSMPMHWQFFWDLGSGFNAKQVALLKVGIDEQAVLRIPFLVKKGVKRVRIDPPPFSKLRLSDLIIKQESEDKLPLIDISQTVIQFNDMIQRQNVLLTSGGEDPFFYFDWPKRLVESGSEVELMGVVTAQYPDKLVKIVNSLGHESLIVALTELGHDNDAAHIELLVEQVKSDSELQTVSTSLPSQVLSVYWASVESSFSEERTSDAVIPVGNSSTREVDFEAIFIVDAEVSQLRIDFPDVIGRVYEIRGIEAFVGEKVFIDPKELSLIFDHALKVEGSRFTVVGSDPHFAFQLNREAVGLKKLVIRGSVR